MSTRTTEIKDGLRIFRHPESSKTPDQLQQLEIAKNVLTQLAIPISQPDHDQTKIRIDADGEINTIGAVELRAYIGEPIPLIYAVAKPLPTWDAISGDGFYDDAGRLAAIFRSHQQSQNPSFLMGRVPGSQHLGISLLPEKYHSYLTIAGAESDRIVGIAFYPPSIDFSYNPELFYSGGVVGFLTLPDYYIITPNPQTVGWG